MLNDKMESRNGYVQQNESTINIDMKYIENILHSPDKMI